jgi:RNA 2',3'-cyclic 3'-phosphodiesterase
VEGGERLRLFCALRLPENVLDALEAWQSVLSGGRLVPRENLHVTLAFLGSRPGSDLPAVVAELRAAASSAERPILRVRGWRETRSVGMLVLDDEGGAATRLAEDVQGRLERLGVYRREARPWLPHVTVLRFREQPRLRVEPPELEPVAPSDAAVYLSRLRPDGARYEVLESAVLGG